MMVIFKIVWGNKCVQTIPPPPQKKKKEKKIENIIDIKIVLTI